MARIRAVLVDIDGVLAVSWRPLPGAVDALTRVREAGYAVALLTNTTSRTRAVIADTLREAGFQVGVEDILTAPALTAAYLAERYPAAGCLLLSSGDVRSDLAAARLVADDDPAPDVVVLGGAGPEFSYTAINRVFAHLHRGARLVAMHRNLYWQTDQGLQLDTGAWLLGLERATGVQAEITGKPAPAFFTTALSKLGVQPEEAVMVGDDIDADVLAAQRLGITGVLVRTGKYQPRTHQTAEGTPDHVLDSFADVPALLDRLATGPQHR